MMYGVFEDGGPLLVPLLGATGPPLASSSVVMTSPENKSLQQAKNEIDLFYREGKWDDYKKITNPYEYIFLSWNRRSSRSVAIRQPLSRSYFKMIELWKMMELDELLEGLAERDDGLITSHAAEGPGGFIEACVERSLGNRWPFKSAYAITLRSEAKNVPGWRKAASFLETHPQIVIHDGDDGTGNILLKTNQDAYISSIRVAHPAGTHLFTADGGFDFSGDYNAQEDSILPLLVAESLLGLRSLTKGGALVIKFFDTLEQPTIDLIWLLSRAFRQWGIVKPRTSRAGNAERYFIGKGFLGDCNDIVERLEAYQLAAEFKLPILRTPACTSWRRTLEKIAEIQMMIEHAEYNVIQETLNLIRHTEHAAIKLLVRSNVLRSIEWCEEHREPIASSWKTDLDRGVQRETSDLLHILHPTNVVSYSGWQRSTSTVSFAGFRTGGTSAPPATNPFMRVKAQESSH